MPGIEEPLSLRLFGTLLSAGFSPQAQHDGPITCRCEGHTVGLTAGEDDPEYAYVWINAGRDNSSTAKRVKALEIANDFNSRLKAIKVTVTHTGFSVYGEAFAPSAGDLTPLLSRLSHAVAATASKIHRSA